jgi:hypothetical protein
MSIMVDINVHRSEPAPTNPTTTCLKSVALLDGWLDIAQALAERFMR